MRAGTIWKSSCRSGETRYVSGTAEFYDGMLQMVHPDRVVDEAGFAELPLVEPVYPLTEGSSARQRPPRNGQRAHPPAHDLPEWQDEAWLAREKFPAFRLGACGNFIAADLPGTSCRRTRPGRGLPMTNCWPDNSRSPWSARICAVSPAAAAPAKDACGRAYLKALPYTLTHSQQKALDDITTDLALPQRMLRLLQGDVGSGKTVVALAAAASVIEAGGRPP